jgi:hypothetical protein
MIPVQTAEQHIPLISFEFGQLKKIYTNVIDWLKQRVAKVSG